MKFLCIFVSDIEPVNLFPFHSFLQVYKKHRGSKFIGFYELMKPTLMVLDKEVIKAVLIKDFDHFVDRRNMTLTSDEDKVMNKFLTNVTGDHWKGIRSVLSPSFTSGRMKGMFPLVEKKADDLVKHLHRKLQTNSSVPLRKSFGSYTLEVISSCAFGMETNSLEDSDTIFLRKVDALFKLTTKRLLKLLPFMFFPWLLKILKVSLSQPELHFFSQVVTETIKQREEEGRRREDFLDIMMDAKKEEKQRGSKTPKYS